MFEIFYKNRFLRVAGTFLFAAMFFVSPLIFFTDLTRNPYYFQITLLNISILAIILTAIVSNCKNGFLISKNILNLPFIVLIFVFMISCAYSLFNHNAFFHSAMMSEALKKGLFTLVNCFFVFYIAQNISFDKMSDKKIALNWAVFFVLWSLLWLFFPMAKSVSTANTGIFGKFFDPYGALVWIAGAIWVTRLLKNFRQNDFIHLALVVCAMASLYGILQYFRIELIWKKVLNPYGNRSVSTFGNPNFISSYVVMLFPLAVAYLLNSKNLFDRLFYGFILLTYQGMLLSSLTRSSWLGAFAGLVFIFSFKEYRNKVVENKKFIVPFFAIALAVLFFWPSSNLKPLSSGLVERVSEGAVKVVGSRDITLNVDKENVYPSYHQRLLIWASAWEMGAENPALGKGWGLFELFYPYYQGPLLEKFEGIRGLRTHANNAHNEILEFWSQTGIIGLGIYIWMFMTLLVCFIRFYKKANQDDRYWTIPFLAAICGMFADNMLNVSLHFAVPAFLFWWIVGAVSLKLSSPCGKPNYMSSLSFKKPAVKIIFATLVFLCLGAIYYWRAQFLREAHYFKGFKSMRKNQFSQAVSELGKAYDYHSREVNNNYEFANAYVRMKNLEKAEWAYSESLKANCGYDEIFFNFAVVNKKLKKNEAALNNLKVSILINPINIANYIAIAEIFMADAKKYSAQAVIFFEDASRIFPFDANIINTLGYFLTIEKRYKEAKKVYARGVKINPLNNMFVENLKMVSARLGLKNDDDMKWLLAYKNLASRLKANDYSDSALKAADKLLEDAPYSAEVLYLKSKILFGKGKYSLSKNCLKKILKINPGNADARYGLAVIMEKEGNCLAAKKEFIEILRLNPGNKNIGKRLERMPC